LKELEGKNFSVKRDMLKILKLSVASRLGK